jgi:putative hemolysin
MMVLWAVLILTLALSALFSGTEIAFLSSNKLKLELDRKKGIIAARMIAGISETPSRFIATLLVGNNVVLVVFGLAMSDLLDPLQGPYGTIWQNLLGNQVESASLVLTLQTFISTLTILFFGEFLPKVLFRINPNNALYLASYLIYPIYFLLWGPTRIFILSTDWILRKIFKVRGDSEAYHFSDTDLHEYIRDYQAHQTREEEDITQEVQMFQNVMEFRNVKLRECMVPRTEIVAVEEGDSVDELRAKLIETRHSRVLVYRESIDNIIGYVHSFDLFKEPLSIRDLTRPVLIVPETMLASRLLSMFTAMHRSVAIVVDEFGGTSGMITPEDVLEEIFGEIRDEFDTDDLTEKQIGDKEYLFSARLEIDYLNDKYSLGLPVSEDYETLAGLILHHHEHIPAVNEEIIIPNFSFRIVQAEATRIEQVMLSIIE